MKIKYRYKNIVVQRGYNSFFLWRNVDFDEVNSGGETYQEPTTSPDSNNWMKYHYQFDATYEDMAQVDQDEPWLLEARTKDGIPITYFHEI